ncbi:cytochrome P450 (plasmid) [Azospirillum sp. B510]|uniref:cytochrome P450 n=1 Tax=Azospirillum sp. (strain B510) TaxID=137722 RepID=UPI0001C4CB9A|nr:cytochrome P450 [Azospirillum sp. B510]BAI74843.1 cytochrome P450 [Azospirillum sp. B510]
MSGCPFAKLAHAADYPDHVPADRVFDVEVYAIPGADRDFHLALKAMHDHGLPDVFWTPRQGGHWVVTRYEDMMGVLADPVNFSNGAIVVPKSRNPTRENGSLPLYPLTADLPEHTAYRALLSPTFSPRGVQQLSELARAVAIRLVEELKPRGSCEFITDFAQHLPIEIFMSIVDVPAEDREWLLALTDRMVRPAEPEDMHKTMGTLFGYVRDLVAKRKAKPGNDLISSIIAGKVFGRPMDDDELTGMCALILIGGMDTVVSAMGFAAWFLARHPDHRRQLLENPELIPNAVDEMLRRHSIVNIGRLVKNDVTVGGVAMKAGDMLVMPSPLGSMDERKFPDPLTVDFTRSNSGEYSTFGKGPHRCPGANLGRAELRIFVEEWLRRIPDFHVRDEAAVGMSCGINGTIYSLPLEWTPQEWSCPGKVAARNVSTTVRQPEL